MRVLVACEESQEVTEAFINRGHDAMSCDVNYPGAKGLPHYQGDVRDLLSEYWDMVIAHPVCKYLTNSGVSWLHRRPGRWELMKSGAEFFKLFLNLPKVEKVVIENPIMHKYAREIIGVDYSQIVQPWMFGHPESKATCLWLKGVDKLKETNNVKEIMLSLPDNQRQRLHYLPPGPERERLRSQTFPGIAAAMAEQWGMNSIAGIDPADVVERQIEMEMG